jgi:hypothetical protein
MPRNDPPFIKKYFHWDLNRQLAIECLTKSPDGTFLLFPGFAPKVGRDGKPLTVEWGRKNLHGCDDRSINLMIEKDVDDRIGIAYVEGGKVKVVSIAVDEVRKLGSFPKFVADMQMARLRVDITRAFVHVFNYEPAFGDDDE